MKSFLKHIKKYAVQYSLTVVFIALLAFLSYTQPNYLASLVGDIFRATGTTSGTVSTSSGGSSYSSNYGAYDFTATDTGDRGDYADSSDSLDIEIEEYPAEGFEGYDYGDEWSLEVIGEPGEAEEEEGEGEGYTATGETGTYSDETSDDTGASDHTGKSGATDGEEAKEEWITIIEPNGGEEFKKGDTITIKWKYADPTISSLYADLYLVPIEENNEEYEIIKIEKWVKGDSHTLEIEEDYEGEYKILAVGKRGWDIKGEDISDEAFTIYVPHELTRAELIKTIVNQYEFPIAEDYENPYSDVDKTSEYYRYITAAYAAGLIDVDSTEQFRPDEIATSEWLLDVLARIELRTAAPQTGVMGIATNIENSSYDIYSKESNNLVVSVRPGKQVYYYMPEGEYFIEYGTINYTAPLSESFTVTPAETATIIGNYSISQ